MKAAKFLLCCLLTALIFLTVPQRTSVAAAVASQTKTYARADAMDIYFCEKKDLNYALFTIPYTYCVEILSSDGEWYYVKYAEDTGLYRALYGYCLKNGLTVVDEPPENIFLNMPVTVTFKSDTVAGALPVLSELNVTAAYYGAYYAGATAYSYVLYDGSFGYIYGANDGYPLNEIPVENATEDVREENESSDSKLVIALVLTGIAAVALILLYLTGRKKYFRPDK